MTVIIAPDRPAGAADFDFLFGRWTVRHRRRGERPVGGKDWVTFGGTMRTDPILRGAGSLDQSVIDLPSGRYETCMLRLFHADTHQWSIHGINGRDPRLDAPLCGSFANGVGIFGGNDAHDGRPIKVRFLWRKAGSNAAHWEQAFSADGGATWETNWTMDFSRV